jgi:hypothetical protein
MTLIAANLSFGLLVETIDFAPSSCIRLKAHIIPCIEPCFLEENFASVDFIFKRYQMRKSFNA